MSSAANSMTSAAVIANAQTSIGGTSAPVLSPASTTSSSNNNDTGTGTAGTAFVQTKQIPPINPVIGSSCPIAWDLTYACGWDAAKSVGQTVQCNKGHVTFVNDCAYNASIPSSGSMCVYLDYGANGLGPNSTQLYLPYCVDGYGVVVPPTTQPINAYIFKGHDYITVPIPAPLNAAKALLSGGVSMAIAVMFLL